MVGVSGVLANQLGYTICCICWLNMRRYLIEVILTKVDKQTLCLI